MSNYFRQTEPLWPPEYQIRKSKRAKRIHLKISPYKGLEIIVPDKKIRFLNINQVLLDHKEWILKTLLIYKEKYNDKDHLVFTDHELHFLSLEEKWAIQCFTNPSHRMSLKEIHPKQIIISGPIHIQDKIVLTLKRWLQKYATQRLLPWITQIENKTKLNCKNITIRGQHSLWGSCNYEKNINLNYKLLFLPKELVEHVMIHELCHTVHLDHSKKFWALLRKFDEKCDVHNKLLREADRYIPRWLQNR